MNVPADDIQLIREAIKDWAGAKLSAEDALVAIGKVVNGPRNLTEEDPCALSTEKWLRLKQPTLH